MTRTAFAMLFGVHLPDWLPAAWVNGTRYALVGGKTEIEELDRLMERTEEPLCTALAARSQKTVREEPNR